jgi:CRP-like cAMP-binding protein
MEWSAVAKAPLFNGLTENEVEQIFKLIPYYIRKYRTGSMIASAGEKVQSLRIVISGIVKGEMVDYSGKVIKIEDIPAPGALAPAFIFGARNSFPVNVVAVSDVDLLVIDKPAFLKLLMQSDAILLNFLNMISSRSQFLSEKIKFLNFKTIKSKLAQYILQNTGPGKTVLTLGMKQDDLAEFFGVARPSVARALGEMEDEGLIEAKGKYIRVIDKVRLERLTSE